MFYPSHYFLHHNRKLLVARLWTLPTIGLLVSSFRPKDAVTSTGWWTVLRDDNQTQFTLENYQTVLGLTENTGQFSRNEENIKLADAVLNTLAVAIPATVIPILFAAFAAFAAYGFAWIRFPGRKISFILVVALLVVPIQIALIPILRDYLVLDLNGTYLGVWLAHTGFGLPLAIFLLYNYISTSIL